MIIRFKWDTGQMYVNTETLIHDMPMFQYKKWVKLFARYGESADHRVFLLQLFDQIQKTEQAIKETTGREELAHLRHMLERLVSMRDQLKGCLS